MAVFDPVTKTLKAIDPSTIPGFIGDFKCTTSNGNCQMYSVGKSSDGDFTYDYSPNPSIISAAGLKTPSKKRMLMREL